MKYLLFPLIALGFGTAALAQPPSPPQSYPPCSKTVTDECAGSPEGAAKPAHHRAVHHAKAASHHRHVAHAAKPAAKAEAKPS